MKSKLGAAIVVLHFVMIPFVWATGEHKYPEPPPASEEFNQLKSLAGSWEGTMVSHGEESPARVEYAVTSGGTAVVETLFPGTEHEMVSVYHDQKGGLTMTHYCSLGNQPQLDLKQSQDQTYMFELKDSSPIDKTKEAHMHALKLTFAGKNQLVQDWTYYEDGQAQGSTVISLTRSV